jgi:hypothetical protein
MSLFGRDILKITYPTDQFTDEESEVQRMDLSNRARTQIHFSDCYSSAFPTMSWQSPPSSLCVVTIWGALMDKVILGSVN